LAKCEAKALLIDPAFLVVEVLACIVYPPQKK
jgi:hypothetical protein